ncbi:MAG: VTT domain-containing protein [Eggerthellaceae bacterium]|nr:VTT domain-containing protein [Eggerthellaceae bacterium]
MFIIDFFLDLLRDPRSAIAEWIVSLGPIWAYTPLFLIIFCETGLVFTPFLPGDSLLFAAGVFCADWGGLNIGIALGLFSSAAILGNTSNYWIGRGFGHAIIDSGRVKSLTPERIEKIGEFFRKWGPLTIVITRFFPIFRTFTPFIAGSSKMNFAKFTVFNAIGGTLWVSIFTLLGFFFGGIPFVQDHFEWIIIAIVVISFFPSVFGLIRAKLSSRAQAKKAQVEEETPELVQVEAETPELVQVEAEAPELVQVERPEQAKKAQAERE